MFSVRQGRTFQEKEITGKSEQVVSKGSGHTCSQEDLSDRTTVVAVFEKFARDVNLNTLVAIELL